MKAVCSVPKESCLPQSNVKAFQTMMTGWLREPLKMGSVVPSSRSLAQLMAAQARVHPDAYVMELGPGTGPMTKAMLDNGLNPSRLILIERDEDMYEFVRKKFPQVTVIHGDAANLIEALPKDAIGNITDIVSSLPLLAMPNELRREIIQQAFAVMEPDGRYIQFSYGLIPPFSPDHLNLKVTKAGRVWDNFPPAAVWVYEKTQIGF
jgi:phosphatidylethanolamine/phosphatidyl-N-methylethanolamine N-methyltransferase